jgi:hypothetical protein
MGYSMGGWGSCHLAPAIPDYWAAAASSAGAGFVGATGRSPPDNLRNTPMMIQIGEKDHAFRRFRLSRDFARALQALHKKDPDGYTVKYREHKGKGHRINDRDTPGWLSRFSRNPLPTKVVWQQNTPTPGNSIAEVTEIMEARLAYARHFTRRSYWLRNDAPGPFQRVVATRDGNTIRLSETKYLKRITLLLDDRLVDLDRPVTVRANGAVLVSQMVPRTVGTLISTLVPRGDRELTFCAELTVEVPDMAASLKGRTLTTFTQLWERAQYHWAYGRLAEAVGDLDAALKVKPSQGPSKVFPALLRLARKREDPRAELEVFRRWAEAAPKNERLLRSYAARCLTVKPEELRSPETALVYARKAIALHKKPTFGLLHLMATAYFQGGRLKEAVETQRKAIEALPQRASSAAKARLEAQLKRYEEELQGASPEAPSATE